MAADAQSSETSLIGASSRSVTTLGDEVARLEQALVDLLHCGAASVGCTYCPSPSSEAQLARALGAMARQRGFVTAHLSLDEYPVDAIDRLVAALLDLLVAPSETRVGGIQRLLDLYFEKHGSHASERFSEAAQKEGASGDLQALCQAYLAAEDDAHREVRAFSMWAEGVALGPRQAPVGVRGVLDAHSGQRVFGELTRVIRALGHAGLVLNLSHGSSIAKRSERQREKSYTLLRELVDNFDSGRGAVCTRIHLTGGDALFAGPKSLQALAPLYARLSLPSTAEPPPPHRTWTSLIRDPYDYVHRPVRPAEASRPKALRSLIRISQGLPPVDAVASMSVGHERIDKSIDRLFHHAEMAGSVLQVLSGEYGSGKTHLLLHLAERALSQGHPVLWLNLERMNLDLGNPAKHLARVLSQSVLPKRGRPSALDRLAFWTRSPAKLATLTQVLTEIADEDTEESKAAKKALGLAMEAEDAGSALEEFLSARDLTTRPGSASYRLDAYRRLLLWLELLQRIEGVGGPVVLIDEAENLYTTGTSETARRSALRTLSFYCGGALPGACVVLAMTPSALSMLRKEQTSLLKNAAEVHSTLDVEDVDFFRGRLKRLTPDEVPAFSAPMRQKLAEKVRSTHKSVRGPVALEHWDELVKGLARSKVQPRVLLRTLVDELEAAWWSGN